MVTLNGKFRLTPLLSSVSEMVCEFTWKMDKKLRFLGGGQSLKHRGFIIIFPIPCLFSPFDFTDKKNRTRVRVIEMDLCVIPRKYIVFSPFQLYAQLST